MAKVKKRILKNDIEYLYTRRFLNHKGHHSTAFILSHVMLENAKSEHPWLEAELKIGDCDRQITLSIDACRSDELQNTLHKLDVLIDTLKETKKAIKMANRDYQKIKNKNKTEK